MTVVAYSAALLPIRMQGGVARLNGAKKSGRSLFATDRAVDNAKR